MKMLVLSLVAFALSLSCSGGSGGSKPADLPGSSVVVGLSGQFGAYISNGQGGDSQGFAAQVSPISLATGYVEFNLDSPSGMKLGEAIVYGGNGLAILDIPTTIPSGTHNVYGTYLSNDGYASSSNFFIYNQDGNTSTQREAHNLPVKKN